MFYASAFTCEGKNTHSSQVDKAHSRESQDAAYKMDRIPPGQKSALVQSGAGASLGKSENKLGVKQAAAEKHPPFRFKVGFLVSLRTPPLFPVDFSKCPPLLLSSSPIKTKKRGEKKENYSSGVATAASFPIRQPSRDHNFPSLPFSNLQFSLPPSDLGQD